MFPWIRHAPDRRLLGFIARLVEIVEHETGWEEELWLEHLAQLGLSESEIQTVREYVAVWRAIRDSP